ncbi:MAG TPA: hypothetical protein DCX67_02300 [Opitutae bacterium]|nr:hypothetical protein [Opitutae bacterium]
MKLKTAPLKSKRSYHQRKKLVKNLIRLTTSVYKLNSITGSGSPLPHIQKGAKRILLLEHEPFLPF